jgi:pimeloyl-ACP methyl ester carboxylesterase
VHSNRLAELRWLRTVERASINRERRARFSRVRHDEAAAAGARRGARLWCVVRLQLIEAGIPGITLPPTVEMSDYKRKWNFIFMMVPDLPAELVHGKEALYVGWWYKNKVYKPGSIPASDVIAYVEAYSRPQRMDAAFDYCRNILVDMDFNKRNYTAKSSIRTLAVGGQYSIPQMGASLQPYFQNCTPLTVSDSGHFVPEEQPAAMAKALEAFLHA